MPFHHLPSVGRCSLGESCFGSDLDIRVGREPNTRAHGLLPERAAAEEPCRHGGLGGGRVASDDSGVLREGSLFSSKHPLHCCAKCPRSSVLLLYLYG